MEEKEAWATLGIKEDAWKAFGVKPQPRKMYCWEYKKCKYKKCPIYGKREELCWAKVGTLCNGEVQGEFAKKYGTCTKCDFFKHNMLGFVGQQTLVYSLIHQMTSELLKDTEIDAGSIAPAIYKHFLETRMK
jgi:hypothetical protein